MADALDLKSSEGKTSYRFEPGFRHHFFRCRAGIQYRGVEQLVARRAHNPEVGGSSPPSATKSVTVVDTISTTVIFYFLPPEGGFLRKTGLFPNISGHKHIVCPGLMRPWSEKIGLSKTAIVIRVETINYYFPYMGVDINLITKPPIPLQWQRCQASIPMYAR